MPYMLGTTLHKQVEREQCLFINRLRMFLITLIMRRTLFSLAELGFIYTRLNNPTNQILQDRLAAIEGGVGAVVFASGTAAISTGLLTLLKAGDHIVASSSLYGGYFQFIECYTTKIGNYHHLCRCLLTQQILEGRFKKIREQFLWSPLGIRNWMFWI